MSRIVECSSIWSSVLEDGFLVAKTGKLEFDILEEEPLIVKATLVSLCDLTRREQRSEHNVRTRFLRTSL